MSGPIVRSGPSKQFSENWDSIFSDEKKSTSKKTSSKSTKKRAVKKKK